MNAKPDRWKSVPGGLDKLNLFYIPPLDDMGYPLIKDDVVIVPDVLIPFRRIPRARQTTHFFIDDYRFECVWNRPQVYAEYYTGKQILSPDFSLYTNYPKIAQVWNTYRSRWVGAYFQHKGAKVIPTVAWADEQSFEFCFAGIEKNTAVAISTRGCSRFKDEFSLGFDAMMDWIEPQLVICGGEFAKVYTGKKQPDNVVSYMPEHQTFCYHRIR